MVDERYFMSDGIQSSHYNPDWLSDDALVSSFIVRKEEFSFLQEELRRSPLSGSVQHYVLIGLRGAGKTTLLKRIAVAIRRNPELSDHLIALSFPEELYQVKTLSDFWVAACESLSEELELLGYLNESRALLAEILTIRKRTDPADVLSDAGFKLLQQFCERLAKRAVLLVDNLDMVFNRIDKNKKNNDPLSPAYWAMREALSTDSSPVVIGGSVRLSEPFTDYDKAFYDFFIPKKLGRLSLDEVRLVLNQLADRQNEPELKARLNKKPSRLEALYDLTGGNPRAVGLIFELLRVGPSSRAVEDFQRLMDITTPYYKARFEDLAEQAQVIMHALAVRTQGANLSLRFGHTASELAEHVGLPTSTVSAQLVSLENEGLVEKTKALGRAQYRISEQLFRLWLQMRGSRRIRQNVIGLTSFLEAMYDAEELQVGVGSHVGAGHLAEAQYAFAVAGVQSAAPLKKSLEAHGADRVFKLLESKGGDINDYLPTGDLSNDLECITRLREQLRQCVGGGLSIVSQEALLGSLQLTIDEKKDAVECLSGGGSDTYNASSVEEVLHAERKQLLARGMLEIDLKLLYSKRAIGLLPLPKLTPEEVENSELSEVNRPAIRSMVWRLLGARNYIALEDSDRAAAWLLWGLKHLAEADSNEWARVAGAFRRAKFSDLCNQALNYADRVSICSRSFYEKALDRKNHDDHLAAEELFRKSVELNPDDHAPLIQLARNLSRHQARHEEAAAIYQDLLLKFPSSVRGRFELAILLGNKLGRAEESIAILKEINELEPKNFAAWLFHALFMALQVNNVLNAIHPIKKALELQPENVDALRCYSYILSENPEALDECIAVHRKLIELDPLSSFSWKALGSILNERTNNYQEAADCFRRAIEINDQDISSKNTLAQILIDELQAVDEAEQILRNIIEIDPGNDIALNNLGMILSDDPERHSEAEEVFRSALEHDPSGWESWSNLGIHLSARGDFDNAEVALRKAIELAEGEYTNWLNLGSFLSEMAEHLEQHGLTESVRGDTLVEDVDIVINKYWNESEAALKRAFELQPFNIDPLLNLGISYKKRGEIEKAVTALKQALVIDSENSRVIAMLGSILAYEPGRAAEAEAWLLRSVDLDPKSANAWNTLGILKSQNKEFEEAAKYYEKSISVDPNFAAAWVNYGHLLSIHLGRSEEAIEVYTKALELNSAEGAVWNNLAIILSGKSDRLEEAENAYRNAISQDFEVALPWHNFYRFLKRHERDEDSQKMFLESQQYFDESDERWRDFYTDVRVFKVMPRLESTISSGDLVGLREALNELFDFPDFITVLSVNKIFVEGFLSDILENQEVAVEVLNYLKDRGFERHARPLLLAFEAAIRSEPASIDNLEPEIQGATRLMYRRLVEEK